MIWSERTDGELRLLYAEGLTCEEIGRAMGTTKNAIVGRSHRLGLYRSHLALPSFKRSLASGPHTAPLGQPAELLRLDPDGCRWPVSPHSAASHCFCNSHRAPGYSYCEKHRKKAYSSAWCRPGNGHDLLS